MLKKEDFCPIANKLNLQEINFIYKISLPFINVYCLLSTHLYQLPHLLLTETLWITLKQLYGVKPAIQIVEKWSIVSQDLFSSESGCFCW